MGLAHEAHVFYGYVWTEPLDGEQDEAYQRAMEETYCATTGGVVAHRWNHDNYPLPALAVRESIHEASAAGPCALNLPDMQLVNNPKVVDGWLTRFAAAYGLNLEGAEGPGWWVTPWVG